MGHPSVARGVPGKHWRQPCGQALADGARGWEAMLRHANLRGSSVAPGRGSEAATVFRQRGRGRAYRLCLRHLEGETRRGGKGNRAAQSTAPGREGRECEKRHQGAGRARTPQGRARGREDGVQEQRGRETFDGQRWRVKDRFATVHVHNIPSGPHFYDKRRVVYASQHQQSGGGQIGRPPQRLRRRRAKSQGRWQLPVPGVGGSTFWHRGKPSHGTEIGPR
mmetsp:Transcript_29146/g.79995  ORF Transcript_29146/g.79995 Transcript_29146/m.79995 type:complete len:222 (-) Transcript_29146:389-1054(-)